MNKTYDLSGFKITLSTVVPANKIYMLDQKEIDLTFTAEVKQSMLDDIIYGGPHPPCRLVPRGMFYV